MINQDKINFLNKYTLSKKVSVKILNMEDINNIQIGAIPNEWRHVFEEEEKSSKINRMLELWEKHVGREMSNTISFMKEFLIDIEVMNIGDRYSILYSIKNSRGRILYYEGRNPKDDFNNDKLESDWSKVPSKIRGFYENLHNGFYYYPSKSMGLSSLQNIIYLDEYEWSILEDMEEHNINIDLTSSYGFFSNGMGSYVVIDYNNCNNDNATLWSSKETPDYNLKFWDVVDEWTVIGFQ